MYLSVRHMPLLVVNVSQVQGRLILGVGAQSQKVTHPHVNVELAILQSSRLRACVACVLVTQDPDADNPHSRSRLVSSPVPSFFFFANAETSTQTTGRYPLPRRCTAFVFRGNRYFLFSPDIHRVAGDRTPPPRRKTSRSLPPCPPSTRPRTRKSTPK